MAPAMGDSRRPSDLKIPWSRLDGKVVMVTGASSGIGRELCVHLARAGCRVVGAARRVDRLRSLCDEINNASESLEQSANVQCAAVELDVGAHGAAIDAAVQRAWDAFGRIDALVNNAGIRGGVQSPLVSSEADWKDTMRTNLTGLWLVSKHVCRRMRDAKQKGSVINISSITGLGRGHWPGGIAYDASKAGVNAATKVMALELGAYTIRVNSISPGLFKSEITTDLMAKEWLNRVAERKVPLRTLGTVDPALTSLVRYLVHDSSEYVSGNIFIVDAGVILTGIPIFSSL